MGFAAFGVFCFELCLLVFYAWLCCVSNWVDVILVTWVWFALMLVGLLHVCSGVVVSFGWVG